MNRALRLARRELMLAVAVVLVAVFVLLLLQGTEPHLLKPAGNSGDLAPFVRKINDVKNPATIALGSVGLCGMLAGGGLLALGQQAGVRIMGMSAGSLAGVLLGNGLIE